MGLSKTHLQGRLDSVRSAAAFEVWTPRSFDLGNVERAFVHVDAAARSPDKRPDRVVRVTRIEAVQDQASLVGHVVAVGVPEKHQVGFLSDPGSAVAQLEACRQMKAVGEHCLFVRPAVAVSVFQDQQFVVRLVRWQVLGIRRHGCDPQPPFGVPREVDRVPQIREFAFAGEQVDGVTFGQVEVFRCFFG